MHHTVRSGQPAFDPASAVARADAVRYERPARSAHPDSDAMIAYHARLYANFLATPRWPLDQGLGTVKQSFRAWPWVCDSNGHLTNARYFTFMDYGRTAWFGATGTGTAALKRRVGFLLAGSAMTYRREIPLGAPFSLHTELAGFDERWWYFTQTFFLDGGNVAARALARGTCKGRSGTVNMGEILGWTGRDIEAFGPGDEFDAWLSSVDATLAAMKRLSA